MGGREGGREGGRKGGREGGREGEGGREEGGREGREGGREGGRERESEGGRGEREREREREKRERERVCVCVCVCVCEGGKEGRSELDRGKGLVSPSHSLSPAARSAASIILRGANDFMVDEMERSVHDALCVVKRVLESQQVVAGGGAVEAALSIFLESLATSIVSLLALRTCMTA